MIIPFLLLLVGFALLIKGSDVFVDGASGLAKKYKLSEMFIGLTIVAFGTSAPELVVNIQSAFQGQTQLSLANIIGSNIANIALILGIGVIFGTFVVAKKVNKDVLLSLIFTFFLFALLIIANGTSSYLSTLFIGILLLAGFAYYFWHTYTHSSADDIEIEPVVSKKLSILVFMIAGGLGAIILGGNFVVDNAIKIAELFGVSSRVIGLTIVALGTSLPELMTTIVSIKKGHHAMGIGNIIGSNIFNIGLIGGITSLIHPIVFESGSYYDFIVLFIITGLLFLFIKYNNRHMRNRQGILFIVIYLIYIISLVL